MAGVALVVYGLHRRRRRVHHDPAATVAEPRKGKSSSFLTSRMERGAIWPAAGLAILLQPWGLVAAGAVPLVEADGSEPTTWLVPVAFCIIATAPLLGAELYLVLSPDPARPRLRALRSWMQGHAEPAIVYGSVVIGLSLAGKSIYELAG